MKSCPVHALELMSKGEHPRAPRHGEHVARTTAMRLSGGGSTPASGMTTPALRGSKRRSTSGTSSDGSCSLVSTSDRTIRYHQHLRPQPEGPVSTDDPRRLLHPGATSSPSLAPFDGIVSPTAIVRQGKLLYGLYGDDQSKDEQLAEQERALRFARSSSTESGRWAPAVPVRKRRRAFCYGTLCITVGLLLLLSPVVVPASRSALARLSLWWGPSGEADGMHPWATCGHAVLQLPSLVQPVQYDLQLAVQFAPRPRGRRKLGQQQQQGAGVGARRTASELATGAVQSGSGTSSVRLSDDVRRRGSSGAGSWGLWGLPWPRWRRAAAAVGGSYGTAGSSTSRGGADGSEEVVRGEVAIAVSVEVGGSCARAAPSAGCVVLGYAKSC